MLYSCKIHSAARVINGWIDLTAFAGNPGIRRENQIARSVQAFDTLKQLSARKVLADTAAMHSYPAHFDSAILVG